MMELHPMNPSYSKSMQEENAFNTPNLQKTIVKPILNVLQTLTLAFSWAELSNTKFFYNKRLNRSCNLLNTLLKVENRMVI